VPVLKLQLTSHLLYLIFKLRGQFEWPEFLFLGLHNSHVRPRNFAQIKLVDLVRFLVGKKRQELNLFEPASRQVASDERINLCDYFLSFDPFLIIFG
jgi:hypothetical protein